MAQPIITAARFRPLNVNIRRDSGAERLYYARAAIPEELAPGLPPTPDHDLIYQGGKTIPHLTFTTFYVGTNGNWQPDDMRKIDQTLSAAMSDVRLNNVMAQYFPGQQITSTYEPSRTLAVQSVAAFNKADVENLVITLYNQGQLANYDLGSTVFCFMLPSGTVLSDDVPSMNGGAEQSLPRQADRRRGRGKRRMVGLPEEDDKADSLHGLGGYHGSVHVTKDDGTQETVYYAVGVYSEAQANGTENGIVAFDAPWKNVVATFYHELNEARTDPDVEDAIRAGNSPGALNYVGWMSREGEECGDFPIFEAASLSQVFQEVELADGSGTVPVQFIYSDAVHGPEGPIDQPDPPASAARRRTPGRTREQLAVQAGFPGAGHGADTRGMYVPRGIHIPSGRFGRLFPTLDSRPPTGVPEASLFGSPNGIMDAGLTVPSQLSKTIPAGFTFFGQFLDHDLDFDPTSSLERQVDPRAIFNFRTPALDLDSIYGSGPSASPYLYDSGSHSTKLLTAPGGKDLARNGQGTALIGDPRNDENMLLSQLDLAFIRFHNAIVDGLASGIFTDVYGDRMAAPANPDDAYYEALFLKAQQVVRWHYQWIIVHEFLPLICLDEILEDIADHGRRYYRPEDTGSEPFIPVEFSVAAYRYGHATIRSRYKVNGGHTLDLFPTNPGAPSSPRTDLRGGPVDPQYVVDWASFFVRDPMNPPQFAKRIEPRLNTLLLDLPNSVVPPGIPQYQRSLATRNLLRSETLELPSGQDVARKIGERVLTDQELGLHAPEPIYLWYYILSEAELRTDGQQLGPVGARIVAEVFFGVLDLDSTSYPSAFPKWQPTLPGAKVRDFQITDLLDIAGV